MSTFDAFNKKLPRFFQYIVLMIVTLVIVVPIVIMVFGALKTRFETVFARFGTAPEHTRHAIFERSHALPIDDVVREILSWLDRYLGSVTHSSRASTPTP